MNSLHQINRNHNSNQTKTISKTIGATEMAKVLLTMKLKVIYRREVKVNKSRSKKNRTYMMSVKIAGISLLRRKIHNIDINL